MSEEIFAFSKGHSGTAEECVLIGVEGSSSFDNISQEMCSNPVEIEFLRRGTNNELPITG